MTSINLVYLKEKVPRRSQTQKWFTGCYSVDNVTQTDIRNHNIILIINSINNISHE